MDILLKGLILVTIFVGGIILLSWMAIRSSRSLSKGKSMWKTSKRDLRKRAKMKGRWN